MRLLDRYVLKNFLVPFVYCFFGFIAIWLVFDLSDNGPDFIEAHVALRRIAKFYLAQSPQIIVICLPVGLLLALLYSLSRMSRANEIISMLTAGRSVTRILMPLIGVGFIATVVCFALNYELAPHAEEMKRVMMAQLTKGDAQHTKIDEQLFRNRADSRTWYVRIIQKTAPQLSGVHI